MRTRKKVATAIAAVLFAAYALLATGCNKVTSSVPIDPEITAVPQ